MSSHHGTSPLSQRIQKGKCRGAVHTSSSAHSSFKSWALLSYLFALLSWSSLINTAAARTHVDPPSLLVEDADLAWIRSPLLLDLRPPPIVPLLMPPIYGDDEATTTLSAPPAKRSIATDPHASNSDFVVPQPLDAGLSNNFTSSCASFINRLRTSDAFKNCHPFSLLLQTSSGFFDASKSFLRITQTLDATCGADETQCKGVMDGFARELSTAGACKADLDGDNPTVIQTLNGLVAYPVAYSASCLKDRSGNYCFANAVSNASSTTDSYPYYLPVGQDLPAGSRPTCNSCLQDAMAVFAQYGNNATQPISKTYGPAAQQLSISCGRSFVNVTAAPLKAAATTTGVSITPTITLFLMLVLYFFQ